ncbi:MAG: potassium channel protein [Bryobacterales bacterium]|nr:potassium channel protein [Bryobacterales bacterium]
MAIRWQQSPATGIKILIAVTSSALVGGTVGFRLIEGQSWFDSFYMTLVTLTTIGYEETIELSQYGRYFNAILIITGFSVIFVAVGMLVDALIRLEILDRFQQVALRRMLKKFSGHYIVCGLGRVGRGVVRQLVLEKRTVVAIDKAGPEEPHGRDIEVPVLVEDATLQETLDNAGTRQAKGLVAALSSDADNVYITLSARVLNPELRIVARASSLDAKKRLLQAGANDVVMPYAFAGYRLAHGLSRPHAADFLDVSGSMEESGAELELGELSIAPSSRWLGQTLAEAGFADNLDVIVLALSRHDAEMQFNPSQDTRLREGDVLVIMARKTTLDRLQLRKGA